MNCTLSVPFKFESAHYLQGYAGDCGNLHGHSYHGNVVVLGERETGTGMLLDFKEAKKAVSRIIEPFDHAYIVGIKDSGVVKDELYHTLKRLNFKMVELNRRSTAENICEYLCGLLKTVIKKDLSKYKITAFSITLYETENNSITVGVDLQNEGEL